ncbi:MAG: hypothetical protein PHQ80_02215 [Candidatus ainarchaeum sp.]|nr:hypothetical protein [Candidatus ainarchaeum sp.]
MRGWLFALVLLGLAFAAGTGVEIPDLNPQANPAFIGAIILLSVSFVAVAYAVSTGLQNPSAIAWSKDQLREVVAGVILVVMVIGAYATINALLVPFLTPVTEDVDREVSHDVVTETGIWNVTYHVAHGCCAAGCGPGECITGDGRDDFEGEAPGPFTISAGMCGEFPDPAAAPCVNVLVTANEEQPCEYGGSLYSSTCHISERAPVAQPDGTYHTTDVEITVDKDVVTRTETVTETVTETISHPPMTDNAMLTLGEEALLSVINTTKRIYERVGEAYFSVALYQGMSVSTTRLNLYYVTWGESSAPFAGISHVMVALNQGAQQLTFQLLSFRVVLIFLSYINSVVPSFILPIGMAFRVFPFTKKIGNTLIALSLGALFMFPASLVLVKEIHGSINSEKVNEALGKSFLLEYEGVGSETYGPLMAFCKEPVLRIILLPGEIPLSIIWASIVCAFSTLAYAACWIAQWMFFLQILWPLLNFAVQNIFSIFVLPFANQMEPQMIYDDLVQPVQMILLPAIAETAMFAIIASLIIAIVTITGTKAIASAIGGDYILYGITRLV